MMDLILEANHLSKVYPGQPPLEVLHGVSFSVESSSFVILTGPSGSGKTTLLNILGTLDSPSAGNVKVDQVDPSSLNETALADFRREKIGFVFQLYHLLPTLTAIENVVLPLIPYRRIVKFSPEQRAKELLELVGLTNRMDHLPGQLSGGEQQRVAIARALINRPLILFADEPTGNLDSKNGSEILMLLRHLNQDHKVTIIMVTHDPSVAKPMDRVFYLKDGRLES